MKTYFFTGGAGYIGSHTAHYFLSNEENCKVAIFDNLSTGFMENVDFLAQKFKERVEFIKGDLNNENEILNALKATAPSAIIHFGGSLIVAESVQKPLLYFENNVSNSIKLLKAAQIAQEQGISGCGRILFSSTATVYTESSEPLKESSPKAPISPYAQSKLMIENILQAQSVALSDFSAVVLRYFNVAGALHSGGLGQRSKNATHLIKISCECACNKREKMEIYGEDYPTKDGTCIRDYIHIDDLAAAHFVALNALLNGKLEKFSAFNVGYNRGFSVKEVIAMVKKVSGVDFKAQIAPRRDGDPAALISDNKAILELGFSPKFDNLQTICEDALKWEKSLKAKNEPKN